VEILSLFSTDIFRKKCDLSLDKIEEQCYNHSNITESSNFSNSCGYQGHGFNSQELLDEIVHNLPRSKHHKLENFGIYQWVNINKKGDFNTRHHHDPFSGIALSGVFYVKVPQNSGKIVFYDPRATLTTALDQMYYHNGSDSFSIEPEENLLLIFPSWLYHSVDPNESDEDRISVSFNIYFNYEK
jgi:hypothetical protein